jgi:hypothetical protein
VTQRKLSSYFPDDSFNPASVGSASVEEELDFDREHGTKEEKFREKERRKAEEKERKEKARKKNKEKSHANGSEKKPRRKKDKAGMGGDEGEASTKRKRAEIAANDGTVWAEDEDERVREEVDEDGEEEDGEEDEGLPPSRKRKKRKLDSKRGSGMGIRPSPAPPRVPPIRAPSDNSKILPSTRIQGFTGHYLKSLDLQDKIKCVARNSIFTNHNTALNRHIEGPVCSFLFLSFSVFFFLLFFLFPKLYLPSRSIY